MNVLETSISAGGRRIILSTLILGLALSSAAWSQQTEDHLAIDVESAVSLALQHNPKMKIAAERENFAHAQVREVAAGALPHISVNSNYSRNIQRPAFFFAIGGQVQKIEIGENNSYVATVQLRQTIFQSGQFGVGKARRIAGLFSQVSREASRLTRDQVILNVRRAFYTVLLSETVVDVFRETLAQTRAHVDNVQKKYKHGVAAEFDLLRSEVNLAEAKAALLEAQNNMKLAKSALKNAIGLPLDKTLKVVGTLAYQPLPEEEVARLSAEALQRRPELQQLNLQLEMAHLNVAIQKGQHLPSLSLIGNYQLQGQSADLRFGALERSTSFTTGLNLQFDLFNGFATSARIQQAQAEANELLHRVDEITRGIRLEIEQARLRMTAAQERIAARQKSLQQARKAHAIAEVRYDSGVGTQLELVDARLALNRTRTNYLQAIYDYNIALFDWQKAVGIIE